ncbi:hypothetical protein RIT80_11425, partial [Streptococcus pneumoniae]|nr:hypothetical protein [Streptococcus pneumoniae]
MKITTQVRWSSGPDATYHSPYGIRTRVTAVKRRCLVELESQQEEKIETPEGGEARTEIEERSGSSSVELDAFFSSISVLASPPS